MNVFGKGKNVFSPSHILYDRYFKLYDTQDGRTDDRSSTINRVEKGFFKATEPQQVQRVTVNLMSTADDGLAMQVGAFKTFTEATVCKPQKGDVVIDQNTKKVYRIITVYHVHASYELMVTELDD